MKVKLALLNRTATYGHPAIEDAVYENVVSYDVLGSFLVLTFSHGVVKFFPVHRIFFVEVTP